MAVTEKKYQLGTAENQEFLQDVRDGLDRKSTRLKTRNFCRM